jgi:hypothetical protein
MIKELDICGHDRWERAIRWTLEISIRLIQVLSVIPRNSLRAFTTTFDLDERTIGLVLKTQTKLLKLAVPSKTLPDNYLRGNLDTLTDLTLKVDNKSIPVRHRYLAFTRVLRNLTIEPAPRNRDAELAHAVWNLKMENLLELRSLKIHSMRIQKRKDSFGAFTHLNKLEFLLLSNCPKMAITIQSLAEEFLKCANSALKSLIIRQMRTIDGGKSLDTELESLLEFIPTLETLCITAVQVDRPSIKSICRHGNTLRYLHVDHFPDLFNYTNEVADTIERYNVEELEQLVSSCQNIEGLSLNLVDIDFAGINVGFLRDPFHICQTRHMKGNISLADLLVSSLQ